MAFALSPLILVAIVYLPIAWWFVARSMLRWMGPVGRGVRRHGAVCGNCGHSAIQRDSEKCPECGVRYSIAGVATPIALYSAAPTVPTVGIVLVPLIILIGVLGAQAMNAALMYARHGVVSVGEMSFRAFAHPIASPSPSGGPRSASFSLDFELKATVDTTHQRPLQGVVDVSLNGASVSTHHLEYEIHTDQWSVRDDTMVEVERGDGVDQGVEALFVRVGLNPDVESTSQTLADTRGWVRELASSGQLPNWAQNLYASGQPRPGRLSHHGGGTSYSSHSFAGGTIASVSGIVIGAVLLAGSLILIVMERRRIVNRSIAQSDQ